MNYEKYMEVAIEEAKISLEEGHKGFGAVIIKDDRIIAKGHDTDVSDYDPTAHAEINVIRKVAREIMSSDLSGYTILSTHEPCPMCSAACIWGQISRIVFGVSIEDTVKLGRNRISVGCKELIEKSPLNIEVIGGILRDRCIELY